MSMLYLKYQKHVTKFTRSSEKKAFKSLDGLVWRAYWKTLRRNMLHSKLLKANQEIYEELRGEGNLDLRTGYFNVHIQSR